ncbi:sulfatase-like hydrolase/transferase [Salinarchaeum chitinilyticum]
MTDQPNVLFIMSDEHSHRGFSHLDPDGRGEPVDTPNLDDLAASSTVFDQAYCQMPLCTPSRLSMLTGQRVPGAGAWHNWSPLLPDRRTMPEAFSDEGYETCLVGKMHFGGDRQFCGFDHRPYGDLTGETGHQPDPIRPLEDNRGLALESRIDDAGVTELPESQLQERNVLTESLSWVREQEHSNPDQPWFLCASISRPHFPLTAPERFLERYWPDNVPAPKVGRDTDHADHPLTESAVELFGLDEVDAADATKARAAYFACIDFIDELIGDMLTLMDESGYLDNTIVVYASDHGELAGEHGLWWKGTWHEASSRVPLMVQTPEQRAGEQEADRIDTPVGLVDLFPTLANLCDVSEPTDIDGQDLSSAIRTGEEPDRGPVVCDVLAPRWGEGSEFRMVRDGRYKYVGFRGDYQELLFDIESDPLERNNLALDPDGDDRSALERLRAYVDETVDFEEVEAQRLEDEEWAENDHLLFPPNPDESPMSGHLAMIHHNDATDGNMYHLPDGRIIDAGISIYKPDVIFDNPAEAYDDWPENEP